MGLLFALLICGFDGTARPWRWGIASMFVIVTVNCIPYIRCFPWPFWLLGALSSACYAVPGKKRHGLRVWFPRVLIPGFDPHNFVRVREGRFLDLHIGSGTAIHAVPRFDFAYSLQPPAQPWLLEISEFMFRFLTIRSQGTTSSGNEQDSSNLV